jgi:hypothetical protein
MPEENFRICADNYLMLYALYLSNIGYIDEELSFYRIHENNGYVRNSNAVPVEKISLLSIQLINELLVKKKEITIPYIDNDIKTKLFRDEEKFVIEPKEYVLYGTGEYSKSVKNYLEHCGATVKYYCDSNDKNWGKIIENIAVISPKELLEKRGEYYKIFIASMWIFEISDALNKLGMNKEVDYIYSEIGF